MRKKEQMKKAVRAGGRDYKWAPCKWYQSESSSISKHPTLQQLTELLDWNWMFSPESHPELLLTMGLGRLRLLLNTAVHWLLCFPADFNLLLAVDTYVPEAKQSKWLSTVNAHVNTQTYGGSPDQIQVMCQSNALFLIHSLIYTLKRN